MGIHIVPEIVTDCRSEEGITIGLIDAIIAICRILRDRDISSYEELEALKDLKADEDLMHLLGRDNG